MPFDVASATADIEGAVVAHRHLRLGQTNDPPLYVPYYSVPFALTANPRDETDSEFVLDPLGGGQRRGNHEQIR
jgi:hypothetical protein